MNELAITKLRGVRCIFISLRSSHSSPSRKVINQLGKVFGSSTTTALIMQHAFMIFTLAESQNFQTTDAQNTRRIAGACDALAC